MDQEDLPIAVPMPMEAVLLDMDEDEEEDIAEARLLQPRNFLEDAATSFLYGMIEDQGSTCWSQERGCNRIVERINNFNEDVYYKDHRTGRTCLHEAW